MDKLVVDGGRTLEGNVRISGAKNASLPILMSTLLIYGDTTVFNIPSDSDITTAV